MYTYVLLALPFSGDESISSKIKGIFPSTNSTPTSGQSTPGHEDVLSKASRLITSLRSDPLSVAGKHSKQLKAKRKRQRAPEREYQKNLVILDYPGENNGVGSIARVSQQTDPISKPTLVTAESPSMLLCLSNHV